MRQFLCFVIGEYSLVLRRFGRMQEIYLFIRQFSFQLPQWRSARSNQTKWMISWIDYSMRAYRRRPLTHQRHRWRMQSMILQCIIIMINMQTSIERYSCHIVIRVTMSSTGHWQRYGIESKFKTTGIRLRFFQYSVECSQQSYWEYDFVTDFGKTVVVDVGRGSWRRYEYTSWTPVSSAEHSIVSRGTTIVRKGIWIDVGECVIAILHNVSFDSDIFSLSSNRSKRIQITNWIWVQGSSSIHSSHHNNGSEQSSRPSTIQVMWLWMFNVLLQN